MFLGQEKRSLDVKGRVGIPAKFREYLKKEAKKTKLKMVLTCGDNNSLVLYPPKAWEDMVEKIKKLPAMKKETKSYRRQIYSNAFLIDFDSAGRILIPQYHRSYADLKNDSIIIGQYDYIEIWSPENWEKYIKNPNNSINFLEDQLTDYL